MHHAQELINIGIENRLSYQTQCAMSNPHRLLESLRPDPGHASHHLDPSQMLLLRAFENQLRGINLPAPGRRHGIRAVAPAEDALVGTRQGGGGLHAEVRGNAVEGVFVARAAAAEGGFCPSAELDARVRA